MKHGNEIRSEIRLKSNFVPNSTYSQELLSGKHLNIKFSNVHSVQHVKSSFNLPHTSALTC